MAVVYNVILPIFLFVIAGILAKRFSYVPEGLGDKLMSFAMKVALPCHILSGLNGLAFVELLSFLNFFWVFLLVTLLILFLSFIYAKYFSKMKSDEIASFAGSSCMSNSCMIAMPVLALTMGHVGVIYGVLALIVLVIMLQISSFIADSIYVFSDLPTRSRVRIALFNSVKNPFIAATLIGIFLIVLNLQVPIPLETTIDGFSATLAPLALFAVGLELDFSVFKKNLVKILGVSFFKLLLMPALAWLIVLALNFSQQASVAVVICSGIASAKCFYGISKEKNIAPELTALAVAGTTILGLITISILVYILSYVFPSAFVMQ